MKNRKVLLSTASVLMALCLLVAARAEPAGDLSAVSPDGRMAIELDMQDGKLGYRVRYREKTVLSYSPLGLRLKDGAGKVIELGEGLEIVATARRCHDGYWTGLGKASLIRDHYEELTVSLRRTQKPHLALEIIMRAYDDGVAFRYSLPGGDGLDEFALLAERTSFSFTSDYLTYAQKLPYYISPYQSKYKPTKLSEIKPESLVGLPLLVEMPEGIWVALIEADLTDYAGMYLGADGGVPYRLRSKLSPLWRRPGTKVLGRTPFITPWRVIMIGEKAGDLIESNLIANLNSECALPDISWIKPGKAVWPWWSGNSVEGEPLTGGVDTRTMLHYIDFAAEANLQYLVIDAGWHKAGDITRPKDKIDLPGIVAYAKERGIGIILWVDWKDLRRRMDEALALYEEWGIAGIKVDYLYRDDQDMVRFYHTLAEKAAGHRLVLDLHGCYKPTGMSRTYPNLLTQEAVLGLEWSRWYRGIEPEHNVTLAFTRLIAGPMDYTPGGFRNATRKEFRATRRKPMVLGTRCHQLAMYVVYESPLQMLCDHPGAYRGQAGFEFLKRVPTVWDETRVVDGKVADYIVIARRSGREWYLGGMTDWTPRDLAIPLDFLGEGRYTAEIYADAEDADRNPQAVEIRREVYEAGGRMRVLLASGGGLAVIFTPLP